MCGRRQSIVAAAALVLVGTTGCAAHFKKHVVPVHVVQPDLPETIRWSVKFFCGSGVLGIPPGAWYTDIEIHNPTAEPVEVAWKLTAAGGLGPTGSLTLGPNGVHDFPCEELASKLALKGFLELEADRMLQVVATYKNIEFSEVKVEKGYRVPALRYGTDRWVYASEYICGDIEPQMPGSFRDIFEFLGEEGTRRTWRPGVTVVDVFVHNSGPRPATYTFRAVESNGAELVRHDPKTLPSGRAVKFDCSVLPREGRHSDGHRSDGFFVIEADSELLSVTFDKTDYNVVLAPSLAVEYLCPVNVPLARCHEERGDDQWQEKGYDGKWKSKEKGVKDKAKEKDQSKQKGKSKEKGKSKDPATLSARRG